MKQACEQWDSPFNPFNSWKVLYHSNRLKAIRDWTLLTSQLPPPVSVTIDPTNKCNQNCVWCLYRGWKEKKQNQKNISIQKLYNLVDYLATWGVKSICIAGGGEPTLYPHIEELVEFIGKHCVGFDLGFICNGSNMSYDLSRLLARYAKFVGFSMDAGIYETYAKLHRVKPDMFHKVLDNIKILRKHIITNNNSEIRIGYKYLLYHNINTSYADLHKACLNAISRGMDDIHFRVAYDKDQNQYSADLALALNTIDKQLRPNLRSRINIYSVTHKYGTDLTSPAKRFKKCYTTPLALTFGADGNMWICCDTRGWKGMNLGSWLKVENIGKYWGSKKHFDMIQKIKIENCPRCTFSFYNELFENVILKDNMNINLI